MTDAERLAWVLWPEAHTIEPGITIAQRAIDAGWQPPPDPHVEIARELWASTFGTYRTTWWEPEVSTTQAALIDAVRRLDLRRGTDG